VRLRVLKEARWEAFLTCVCNVWTYFDETYHNYSLPGPLEIDDIFKAMSSEVNVIDNILQKCTSSGGILINGYQSKTSSFYTVIVRKCACHVHTNKLTYLLTAAQVM